MSPVTKKLIGSVLSAAVAAGVAFIEPQYQQAALGLFAAVMAALHIPRPGDVKAGE